MILSDYSIDSINENFKDISSGWLWSSEPIYDEAYRHEYHQPISIEAATLLNYRWQSTSATITIRSNKNNNSNVIWCGYVEFIEDVDNYGQIPATKIASGNISNTEFEQLDGLSANIQIQFNTLSATKANSNQLSQYLPLSGGILTGPLSGTAFYDTNFIGSKVLISDTDKEIIESSITNTELSYLTNVSANIQTQINQLSQLAISGAGAGTTNRITKFITSSSMGDSSITDNGSLVTFSTPVSSNSTINATNLVIKNPISEQIITNQFIRLRTSSVGPAYVADVSGDALGRFAINSDGKIEMGSGAALRDTNLYRGNTDLLKTDDSLSVRNNIRATNYVNTASNTDGGAAIEMHYLSATETGRLLSFDRTASIRKKIEINGSEIRNVVGIPGGGELLTSNTTSALYSIYVPVSAGNISSTTIRNTAYSGGKALVSDNNKTLVESSITSAQLNYLNTTSANIQTQLTTLSGITNYSTSASKLYFAQRINILEYIPEQYWDGIFANSGTYDCTPAIQRAIDENNSGFNTGAYIYFPKGWYRVYGTVFIPKNITIGGDGSDWLYGGSQILKMNDVDTFVCGNATSAIGTSSEVFQLAPKFENIAFREAIASSAAQWSSHMIRINTAIKGGFDNCGWIMDGATKGACIYYDISFDQFITNCFFRGGGADNGEFAQIYIAPQREVSNTAEGDHNTNEIKVVNTTFEWAPTALSGIINPETGTYFSSTSLRSVALKAVERPGTLSHHNSCRFISCKFECITTYWAFGANNIKEAIYLDGCTGFQFIGCQWNQTSRIFRAIDCRSLEIQGNYGIYYEPNYSKRFGYFINCNGVDIKVAGYGVPGNTWERCVRVWENMEFDANTNPTISRDGLQTGEFGARYLATYSNNFTGNKVTINYDNPTGDQLESKEFSSSADYAYPLFNVKLPYLSDYKDGMTFRYKMSCSGATVTSAQVLHQYTSQPRTIAISGDGITNTFFSPRWLLNDVDISGSGFVPISVTIRDNATSGTSAASIISSAGATHLSGGYITIDRTPTSGQTVVISRGAYRKSLYAQNITNVPTWYSFYVTPAICQLENTELTLSQASNNGVKYLLHEFEMLPYAQNNVFPYYPASAGPYAGPGQVPNATSGWDAGWRVGSVVKTINRNVQGCGAYICTSAGVNVNYGLGTWIASDIDHRSYVNTGTTNYILPATITFFGNPVGRKREFSNNGTSAISISTLSGNDIKIGSSITSAYILPIGESVTFLETNDTTWSLVAKNGITQFSIQTLSATSLTVGNVSNTEFQYLDGVSANIQTQINNISGTSHQHSNKVFLDLINQSLNTSASPSFDKIFTTSDGLGTNIRIGNDAWIGDVNQPNTITVRGESNSATGYIRFGEPGGTFGYDGDFFTMDKALLVNAAGIVTSGQVAATDGTFSNQVFADKITCNNFNTAMQSITATATWSTTQLQKHITGGSYTITLGAITSADIGKLQWATTESLGTVTVQRSGSDVIHVNGGAAVTSFTLASNTLYTVAIRSGKWYFSS